MPDPNKVNSDRYCFYLEDECFYQDCKNCFRYRGNGEELKYDEEDEGDA